MSLEFQLWSEIERQPDKATPLLRVSGIDHVGSKGATLRLSLSTAADFDPLLARQLVAHVRDEDPLLTSLFNAVDRDRVTGAHAVPERGAHEVALATDFGPFPHPYFLLGDNAQHVRCEQKSAPTDPGIFLSNYESPKGTRIPLHNRDVTVRAIKIVSMTSQA